MSRPTRETDPQESEPRRKLIFGQMVPCEKCKLQGRWFNPSKSRKETCPLCNGLGYREVIDAVADHTGRPA